MTSRHGKAPSTKARTPAPVDIITLGRCIKPECRALLYGPRPGPRVQRIFIVCGVCDLGQRIERKVFE